MLKEDIISGFVDFLEDLFRDCGWPPQVANIPVRVSITIIYLIKHISAAYNNNLKQ